MTSVSSISSARVSGLLIRSRLVQQIQSDQRELFRIQTQLSTGRRIALPSEDVPAAVRAISLQRLIERKEQAQINLQTNESYLSATESALSNVTGILSDVRGSVLSVTDTTSSDQQRQAVAEEIDRALSQLVDAGNQRFRGRHLFAGTRTSVRPFLLRDNVVEYVGNEGELQSFSDIDVLFESSVDGNSVFGAVSTSVRGTADLNPVLTSETALDDLRGGLGISVGSLEVSDGVDTVQVDISGAATLGDVARLIETNPPAGRQTTVSILPEGLKVELDTAGGGELTIREVGGGTTANELGILAEDGEPSGIVLGADLDPIVRLGTPLNEVFGARAQARLASPGPNNDLTIQATDVGAQFNGVQVQLVNDRLLTALPGVSVGNEFARFETSAVAAQAALTFPGADNDLILTSTTPGSAGNDVTVRVTSTEAGPNPTASYDASTKTLSLNLEADGSSTGSQVATAIAGLAGTPFSVSLDTSAETTNTGSGTIGLLTDSDFASTGSSGGEANTLYVHVQAGQSQSRHVVDAINAEGTFTAEIDLRDALTAVQAGFGVVDPTAATVTEGGSGSQLDLDSGIQITSGEETFEINFDTAETVEDLLNAINGSGAGVLAQINAAGTGIDVRSRVSGNDFAISENGGATASQLGIRTFTADTRLTELNLGLGVPTAQGTDFTVTTSDGTALDIDVDGLQTVGQVIDAINNHPGNTQLVQAQLAAVGNGIELIELNPTGPGNFQVDSAPLSLAAEYLGLVPEGTATSGSPTAATLSTGVADLAAANTDLTFSARSPGTALNGARIEFVNNAATGDQALVNYDTVSNTLTVDIDPANTRAVTVAAAVNGQPGGLFDAQLNTDNDPNTGQGIIAETGVVATLAGGTGQVLAGRDVNPQETNGVFNTLIRLRQAVNEHDVPATQRYLEELDADLTRLTFARAELGARQQGTEVLKTRLENEEIELRSALSLEIDVDIAEAISDLTSRQASFEATLRTSSSILQLSLLDFL